MTLYKIISNNTILNGTLVRLPEDVSQQTTTEVPEDYDAEGAMKFIIATILLYSIFGVFCTLFLRIKRVRGKGHQNYLQDESVTRYLKTENLLKLDSRKMKWLEECQIVSEKVKEFEERHRMRSLHRELSSGEFCYSPVSERKSLKNKRKRKSKKRELGNTISKMGVSLFYVGSRPQIIAEDTGNHSDDSRGAGTSAKENEDLIRPCEQSISLELPCDRVKTENNNLKCPSEEETGC